MNIERDKALTIMMGECWHDWRYARGSRSHPYCSKCDSVDDSICQDYSTMDGLVKLLNFVTEQKWFSELPFVVEVASGSYTIHVSYLKPDVLADAVFSFLKEREK